MVRLGELFVSLLLASVAVVNASDCISCTSSGHPWCTNSNTPLGPGDGNCMDEPSVHCGHIVISSPVACPALRPGAFKTFKECCRDQYDYTWCQSVYDKDSNTQGYCREANFWNASAECHVHTESRVCPIDLDLHLSGLIIAVIVISSLCVFGCIVACIVSCCRRRNAAPQYVFVQPRGAVNGQVAQPVAAYQPLAGQPQPQYGYYQNSYQNPNPYPYGYNQGYPPNAYQPMQPMQQQPGPMYAHQQIPHSSDMQKMEGDASKAAPSAPIEGAPDHQ